MSQCLLQEQRQKYHNSQLIIYLLAITKQGERACCLKNDLSFLTFTRMQLCKHLCMYVHMYVCIGRTAVWHSVGTAMDLPLN